MQWTGLNELREKYLSFFESKGHLRLDSFPLVPKNDPSLLLINSGMAPMKKWFLAQEEPPRHRVTTCQKCIRTPDIERVGITARHGTFFEMLGNFSFQDYFKDEVIPWAWEFLTSDEWMAIPKDRLHISVYEEDDEAYDIWTKKVGIAPDHMVRLGKEDNFWEHGSGPCGPCSEIYFDRGPEYGCGKPTCGVGCDCDRYMEIWNLVFSQFDADGKGHYERLARPNIDTGMGLERLACVMQGVGNLFEVDTVQSVLHHVEHIAGKTYGENAKDDISIRVITDHIRSCTFMVSDGILPSNEGRGYVLRRLLRRAVYHGRLMGIKGQFLTTYAHEVTRLLGDTYPELVEQQALIDGIINAEEERFGATLDNGEEQLKAELSRLGEGEPLSGDVAFTLHDTYGFPIDLTREIAGAAGHSVDMDAFDAAMEAQRERARATANRDAWGKANNVWVALSDSLPATEFDGYDHDELSGCEVVAIVRDGESVKEAATGDQVELVLDRTPFYGEMGGQVGDTGIVGPARVTNTLHHEGGLVGHVAEVTDGAISVGDRVTAVVDHGRRELIRRNHTATHLLDAALKKVLGDHVSQAGSLVAPDRLRFDFTHFEAMTKDELDRVEGMVNAEIFAAEPIVTEVMGIDEAKASGAVALFGEKYGERVRVVSTGSSDKPFSRELCGGTHARNTADLGLFKIVSESSVGSNARRIEAVTSMGAIEYVDERLALMDQAAATLKCRPADLPERVSQMRDELREAKRNIGVAKGSASGDVVAAALRNAKDLGAYRCVFTKLNGISGKGLRSVWDSIRDGAKGEPVACVVASTTSDGKVALLAAGTESAVAAGFSAGDIIKQIAGFVGGRGGGRPNMAQAGGSDASGITAALDAAKAALGA